MLAFGFLVMAGPIKILEMLFKTSFVFELSFLGVPVSNQRHQQNSPFLFAAISACIQSLFQSFFFIPLFPPIILFLHITSFGQFISFMCFVITPMFCPVVHRKHTRST
ncbi:hypothetical protein Ancab_002324 [Ancistrocladus abbreviatus]